MNFRAEGDRVPTRERGYRSANQNMRRRDLHKKNIQNLQNGAGGAGAGNATSATNGATNGSNTLGQVNEPVAELPNEHDLIPQGL